MAKVTGCEGSISRESFRVGLNGVGEAEGNELMALAPVVGVGVCDGVDLQDVSRNKIPRKKESFFKAASQNNE